MPIAWPSERLSDGSTNIVDSNRPPTNNYLLSHLRGDQVQDCGEPEMREVTNTAFTQPFKHVSRPIPSSILTYEPAHIYSGAQHFTRPSLRINSSFRAFTSESYVRVPAGSQVRLRVLPLSHHQSTSPLEFGLSISPRIVNPRPLSIVPTVISDNLSRGRQLVVVEWIYESKGLGRVLLNPGTSWA
jgi:hypothetical protein